MYNICYYILILLKKLFLKYPILKKNNYFKTKEIKKIVNKKEILKKIISFIAKDFSNKENIQLIRFFLKVFKFYIDIDDKSKLETDNDKKREEMRNEEMVEN